MFYDEDLHCDPAVLHAFSLLDDCGHGYHIDSGALDEARKLIRAQIRGDKPRAAYHQPKHWLHVFAVLNRETKGRC